MAKRTDTRQRTTLGNRFRFLMRALGATALLAIPVGYALAIDALPTQLEGTAAGIEKLGETFKGLALEGTAGLRPRIGTIALIAGFAVILLVLLLEVFGALFLTAGRKTAVRTNSLLQIGLATALVLGVNLISSHNPGRFDLTRDKQFTFPAELISDLRTLRPDSPTTVVVLQLHKTAGTLSDKSDAYENAAERKVVEKVEDVVDQLREFGPRFNVVVLDSQDEGYERAVKNLTRTRPGLASAIAGAPENSIFFYADGKVRSVDRSEADRLANGTSKPAIAPDPDNADKSLVYPGSISRLGFADFYLLDKTGSREADNREREGISALIGSLAYAPGVRGKGNLVLIPRGKEAFVRKVLALEERKPRIGLAVIHPLLTSREQYDEYTAGGMRHSLEANGFEVVDIILKKWGRGGPPSASVSTYEESELDRTENRLRELTNAVSRYEQTLALGKVARVEAEKAIAAADAAKTDDAKRTALIQAVRAIQPFVIGRIQTEGQVRRVVAELPQMFEELARLQAEASVELSELEPKFRALLSDDRAAENRRLSDIKTKMKMYTDDCDLLIVPRLTVIDLARGDMIPPSLYNLAKEQSEVVKEFLKAGKPVLFAMGPTNVDRRGFGAEPAGDDVEKLLPQLGIELGKQTIITNLEGLAMAERQNEALGSSVELPPLQFDFPLAERKSPNPVTAAFRTTARAVDRKLDVKKSGYRPVYVSAVTAKKLPYAAEIAYTVREAWNEEKPIPDDEVPKYDQAKPDDPKKGTWDEERRGPFPIGVALETKVPAEWFDDNLQALQSAAAAGLAPVAGPIPPGLGVMAAEPLTFATGKKPNQPTVRIVALGHGGLFTGKKLDPAHETLLLHSVNWQLHRDDRLPHDLPDAEKWRFPRADLTPRAATFWTLGTVVGLPALVVYFGFLALMFRKMR